MWQTCHSKDIHSRLPAGDLSVWTNGTIPLSIDWDDNVQLGFGFATDSRDRPL